MKLLRLPDSIHSEFEADSAEKAIEIAREKLGDYVDLRCWKVRHGGLFGFFAREFFVAGVKEPDDSGNGFERGSNAGFHHTTLLESRFGPDPEGHLGDEGGKGYSQILSHLAESTNDELDIGSCSISNLAFNDLLAEAEAEIAKASKAARLSGQRKSSRENRPGDLEIDFFEKLHKLGVGRQHLSWNSPHSLDAVLDAFQHLPKAPKIPCNPGSVVVIVGAKDDIGLCGETVAKCLGVSPSEIIQAGPPNSIAQKVSRRRRSKKVSIILCEAPIWSGNFDLITELFHKIRPSYVLGSVSASSKCSDVRSWRSKLGKLDAIALHSLDATTTPGEMLGELPIAFLDGRPATPLLWLVTLLRCLEVSEI